MLIPALQLLGACLISIGLGMFSLPLGVIAAGVCLLIVGLAFEVGE